MIHSSCSQHRRGMATLVALLAITLSLGVCFAMLRTHTTSRLLQNNTDRLADVRRAANSGLHSGLSTMHSAAWAGVGTSYSVKVDDDTWYQVEYLTGDASLPLNDIRRAYRVTIRSTGYGTRPQGPDLSAAAEAVVELTPRGLAPEPVGWSGLEGASVLHWDPSASLELEPPNRLAGVVRSYGPVELATQVPPHTNAPFKGRLDEVAVWSDARSPLQVFSCFLNCVSGNLRGGYSDLNPDSWWRMDEDRGTEEAINEAYGADGRYFGALLQQAGVPVEAGNRAARFDGHNDLVLLGDEGTGPGLTVFAWLNEEGPGDGSESYVIGRGAGADAGGQVWALSVVSQGATRHLRFRLRTEGGTASVTADDVAIVPNTWNFVAATYDQSRLRLFINGTEVEATAHSGAILQLPQAVTMLADRPPGSERAAYLRGLAEDDNNRTLTGVLETPLATLTSLDHDLATEALEATVNDLLAVPQAPASFPSVPTTYQLYAGGKTYTAGSIGAFESNARFAADPETNPLGLFTASGNVTFGSNVAFEGVLLAAGGGLKLSGSNISLRAATLPSLAGSSDALQIPVAILEKRLEFDYPTSATVEGLVMSWDRAKLPREPSGSRIVVKGALAASRITLEPRSDWPTSDTWWRPKLAQWNANFAAGYAVEPFPRFLEHNHGLSASPELTVEPPEAPTTYHWHDWLGPLFVPAGGDEHLRWHVVRWQES